jgi:hypothetical protein
MFSPLKSSSSRKKTESLVGSPKSSTSSPTASRIRGTKQNPISPLGGIRSPRDAKVSTPRCQLSSPLVAANSDGSPGESASIEESLQEEVLISTSLQLRYIKRQLEKTATEEKLKAENDLLKYWQLVYDAEEEQSVLEDRVGVCNEIVAQHCALQSLVGEIIISISYIVLCFA